MHMSHYLNEPLNRDQTTQISSFGGPMGNQKVFTYFTHWTLTANTICVALKWIEVERYFFSISMA